MAKLKDIELPTNKKFGLFFAFIFFVSAVIAFLYLGKTSLFTIGFAVMCALFFVISLTKADLLFPLNKMWMSLGLLIGMVISPIVLGLIFFGIFTPVSIITRLFGRDELRLRFMKKETYWITREENNIQADTFKYQY